MYSSKQKGFTLIELLVVIAIIALLSSVVLTSVSAAREKAAISKIVQQIRQVQTALEMYKTDHGDYPDYNGVGQNINHIIEQDLGNYIQKVVIDYKQISSFSIDNLYYNKNKNALGYLLSCEGSPNTTPYTIHFNSNRTDLDFRKLTISIPPSEPAQIAGNASYCISTPI